MPVFRCFAKGTMLLSMCMSTICATTYIVNLDFENGKAPVDARTTDDRGRRSGVGVEASGSSQKIVTGSAVKYGTYAISYTASPNNKRAEAKVFHEPTGGNTGHEEWYGLAVYIPRGKKGNGNTIISQYHRYPDFDLGENWGCGPSIALVITAKMGLSFHMNSSARQVDNKSCSGTIDYRSPSVYSFRQGIWYNLVLHYVVDYRPLTDGGTGTITIFVAEDDGEYEEAASKKGPIGYNDARPNYWKWGTYQPWGGGASTVYFDNIRFVYAEDGCFEAVDPQKNGTGCGNATGELFGVPSFRQNPGTMPNINSKRMVLPMPETLRSNAYAGIAYNIRGVCIKGHSAIARNPAAGMHVVRGGGSGADRP